MKRVACYLRVSTTEQTVENQRNDLRLLQRYGSARGPRTRKSKTKTHTGR